MFMHGKPVEVTVSVSGGPPVVIQIDDAGAVVVNPPSPVADPVLDWSRGLTAQQVYDLGMAIKSGRLAVGCDNSPKEHWTDWEARTGLVCTELRTAIPLVVENVDFTGTVVAVRSGEFAFENCYFGPSGAHFHLDVYDAKVTARRCSFFGPGDGTGAGTLARRRPNMSGGLEVYRCDLQGYASDAVKISKGDVLAFSRLDAPTTYGVEPTTYDPGRAYKVGETVAQPGVDPGAYAFVWLNTIDGNAQAPDFDAEDGRRAGEVINGWELRNPHSDNMTLVKAQDAVVFGNLINLDATRRVLKGSKAQNGTNGNIHSSRREGYSGTLIAANTLLRAERDKGGTPIGPVSGAVVAANVIEKIGHDTDRWFGNSSATYQANWDGTPDGSGLITFNVIDAPSQGVQHPAPAEWAMFDAFADANRADIEDVIRALG
jgi:hypothetical protein